MDLSSAIICPSPAVVLLTLFCVIWPFVVLGMLQNRARSSAPVAAILAPFAASTAGMWYVLSMVAWGRTVAGVHPRAEAAGIAEALGSMTYGAFAAALIAVFALLRRHVPVVDAVTAAILFVTVFSTAAGIVAGEDPGRLTPALGGAAMIAGTVVAAVAVVWTAWQARGTRALRAIPYGLVATLVVALIVAAIVWERAEHHFAFAAGR